MAFDIIPQWFFLIFLVFIGISIGSFLNVLIDRLPQERSINGRSICDSCKHQLAWYDLIPLFSFILLKGKCRYCSENIPSVIPFIELSTGVFFSITWIYLGGGLIEKIIYLGIISCLIVIFMADAKYQIIPDSIQLVLFIFIVFLFLVGTGRDLSLHQFFLGHFLSGLIIMLPILLIYLLTKGKGMGFGDVKFSFIMGFLLGALGGFLALYVAFITGAVVGLILIFMKKKKLKNTIAFGPFLVIGLGVMLVWGEKIVEWVKRMYGI